MIYFNLTKHLEVQINYFNLLGSVDFGLISKQILINLLQLPNYLFINLVGRLINFADFKVNNQNLIGKLLRIN